MNNLIYKQEAFDIYGAAIEVHKELGNGFLEPVYQEALEIEVLTRNIPFEPQKRLQIFYKDVELKKKYIPDFVCYEAIIVEIKALNKLTNIETAQVLNYLKVTKFKLGLLINFGSVGTLERKRLVF